MGKEKLREKEDPQKKREEERRKEGGFCGRDEVIKSEI